MNLNPIAWPGNALRLIARIVSDGLNQTRPITVIQEYPISVADADLALVPKGAGSLIASVSDGTIAGGNKRGNYATDLQRARNAATQVASSTYCVIIGGQNNTAGAFGSCVLGGANHSANGVYSVTVGGNRGNCRGIDGYAVFSPSNDPISTTQGGNQLAFLVIGRQTTDATPTILASNPSAATTNNQIVLPNNSAYAFKATVIAGVTGAGNTKAWEFRGAIKRGASAATAAIVGSVIKDVLTYDAGAAAWDVNVAANTTIGCLEVTVTGQAATTIRWVCKIETTEMTY